MSHGRKEVPRARKAKVGPVSIRFRVFERRLTSKGVDTVYPYIRVTHTEPGNEQADWPWIYVFYLGQRQSFLLFEAQVTRPERDYMRRIDEDARYILHSWPKSQKHKTFEDGKPVVTEFTLLHSSRHSSSQHWIMLSRIRLPKSRLAQYVGKYNANEDQATLVKRRCIQLELSRFAKIQGTQSSIHELDVPDPIASADFAQNAYTRACTAKQAFELEKAGRAALAEAAASVGEDVIKENSSFRSSFNLAKANAVVRAYRSGRTNRKRLVERRGKQLVATQSDAAYVEAVLDYAESKQHLEEHVAICRRHAACTGFSRATQELARSHIEANNASHVYRLIIGGPTYDVLRKSHTAATNVAELMAEHAYQDLSFSTRLREVSGVRMVTTDVIVHQELMTVRGLEYWFEMRRSSYLIVKRPKMKVWHQRDVIIEHAKIDPLKQLSARAAGGVLFVLEIIGAFTALQQLKENRNTLDYVAMVGAVSDVLSAAGSIANSVLKERTDGLLAKQVRNLRLDAELGSAINLRRMAQFGAVLSAIGFVGNISDLVGSAAQGQSAANSGDTASFLGSALMFSGQSLGLASGLGLVEAGSLSGVAASVYWALTLAPVLLVVLGLLVILWFQDTPLESWLRQTPWGDAFRGKSDADLMLELHRMLAVFDIDVQWTGGDYTDIVIKPGFVTAKSKYSLTIETHPEGYQYTGAGQKKSVEWRPALSRDGAPKEIRQPMKVGGKPFLIRIEGFVDLFGDGSVRVPDKGHASWLFSRWQSSDLIKSVSYP